MSQKNKEWCLQMIQSIDEGHCLTPFEKEMIMSRKGLIFSGTDISFLPNSIGLFSSLKNLDLEKTNITELPETMGELSSLERLILKGTKISTLPKQIGKLTSLQSIDISYTNIVELPEFLGNMPNLKRINLSGLKLKAIPKTLAIKGLPFVDKEEVLWRLHTDVGINLRDTIIIEQKKNIFLYSPELILSLYENDEAPVSECKVIFLGDGGVGKSYTIKRFRNEGLEETKELLYTTTETPGVEISDFFVSGEKGFTIHFWDFGGQQLLHSMHCCFLTEQTCYVVTVRTRQTEGDRGAEFWLKNVNAFAPNAPILLFVNCWDNDDGTRLIDEKRLRKSYPNIVSVVYCSAKNSTKEEFCNSVMNGIIKMASESDGCRQNIPRRWDSIRKALEKENRSCLTKERFKDICTKNGENDDRALQLLTFFNNIGVCFSYHRDRKNKRELMDYKLLNPVWLTNALYAIIKEGMAHADNGIILLSSIKRMLCSDAPQTIDGKAYSRTAPELKYEEHECSYIIDVAVSFDLCCWVDKTRLFIPALCNNTSPDIALTKPADYPIQASYVFEYDYLPDNVVHQLMVRCLRKDFAINECWLKGMVIGNADTHKTVIWLNNIDDTLNIDVYSKPNHSASELFLIIRDEILVINTTLNLKAREFIVDEKDRFLVADLVEDYRDDMDHIKCVYGNNPRRKIYVGELLYRFFDTDTIYSMEVAEDGGVFFSPYQFHLIKKNNPFLRQALCKVYNHKCPYCGEMLFVKNMHVDHILPRKHKEDYKIKAYLSHLNQIGFDTEVLDYVENYLPSCSACNQKKSNKTWDLETLKYYHDLAKENTPRVIKLMEALEAKKKEEGKR